MSKLPILFDSPDYTAIDKPPALATIPGRGETDSAFERLARQIGLPSKGSTDPRLRVVHRLDKDTTGVLLFAKHSAAQRHVSHQFQNNKVEKQYLALVAGVPKEDEGVIEAPLDVHPNDRTRMHISKRGRPAVTAWNIEQRFRHFALIRCFPKTGKTHQIRVHLAHLGYPLAVDAIYGSAAGFMLSRIKRDYRPKRDEEERPLIARLSLHAESLAFSDLSGQRIAITASAPKDFRAALNMLTKYGK